MGLRQRFVSYAVGGAHVLAVEVPGSWPVRVALEQAMAARGWRAALSPADADVLVVCGEPGEQLAAAVDRVWDQLPGPRARIAVQHVDTTAAALNEAADLLLDERHQRGDARGRLEDPTNGMDHGDMDHGDMEMAPAGIPLASAGPDRDGLEMDVLHVPLGPVLPHWPAGLVLRCSLQGDVVTEARVEVLESAAGRGWASPEPEASARAARRCDGVGGLLAIAGWDGAAVVARRTRDALLSGTDPVDAGRRLNRLRSRVAGSWSLRWALRGLGRIDDFELAGLGLPGAAGGDVHDRLVASLWRASADLRGERIEEADPGAVLAALPRLVTGLDLAAVRLVVASFDPDTAAVAREPSRG